MDQCKPLTADTTIAGAVAAAAADREARSDATLGYGSSGEDSVGEYSAGRVDNDAAVGGAAASADDKEARSDSTFSDGGTEAGAYNRPLFSSM